MIESLGLRRVRYVHRRRAGMSYVSLLDMLTCCFGAIILMWLFSSVVVQRAKGIAPGKVIEFRVSGQTRAKIGVRAKLKDGIRWAGDSTPINPPIVIEPSEEGKSEDVRVILTGEYDDQDALYLFIHELENGRTWSSLNDKIQVTVSVNGAPYADTAGVYELYPRKLFHRFSINDLLNCK